MITIIFEIERIEEGSGTRLQHINKNLNNSHLPQYSYITNRTENTTIYSLIFSPLSNIYSGVVVPNNQNKK